ncbi:MAG TPA: hypothetical protein VHA52_04075 [Candidatus Babeliaceae bacterium]|nr:hypothetical protein [Candidatus Babeliaceae bacterium]
MRKLLLTVYLIAVQLYALAQCHCPNEEKGFTFKNKITICGTTDEINRKDELVLSEITVKDCSTKKYLMDSRLDGTETFAVKQFSDSITITSLQLIPDSSLLQLISVPLDRKVLKIASNGNPNISRSRFVFKIPSITDYQKRYIDSLCKILRKNIKQPTGIYPSDENSIYVLFLGALVNYGSCYDLFANLDKYYTLDGAIAETKEEIPFEYIIKNIRNR